MKLDDLLYLGDELLVVTVSHHGIVECWTDSKQGLLDEAERILNGRGHSLVSDTEDCEDEDGNPLPLQYNLGESQEWQDEPFTDDEVFSYACDVITHDVMFSRIVTTDEQLQSLLEYNGTGSGKILSWLENRAN